MRRLIAAAALLAASPALAAGIYVPRDVQDGFGAHKQSWYDESGIGIGPFDPVTALPPGFTIGGGGGSSALPPQGVTMTVTNPSITGGATPSVATLAANSSRKYLQIYNEGAQDCRMGYGADPGLAGGILLPPRSSQTLETSAITFQSIWFRCPVTSQIDITEGQ